MKRRNEMFELIDEKLRYVAWTPHRFRVECLPCKTNMNFEIIVDPDQERVCFYFVDKRLPAFKKYRTIDLKKKNDAKIELSFVEHQYLNHPIHVYGKVGANYFETYHNLIDAFRKVNSLIRERIEQNDTFLAKVV